MLSSGFRRPLAGTLTVAFVFSLASACASKPKWRAVCSSQNEQRLREELLAVSRALSVEWNPVVSCDVDDEALFVDNEPAGGAPTQAVVEKVTTTLTHRGWTVDHPPTTSGSIADVETTAACLERTVGDAREFAQLFTSSPTVVRMVHPSDPKAEYCLH